MWPDDSIAPQGRATWSHPTDEVCVEMADPDAVEIDDFLLCGTEGGLQKIAIDDPIYERCDAAAPPAGVLVSIFDGSRARGFPVAMMRGRELVNTDWDGEPILVDY